MQDAMLKRRKVLRKERKAVKYVELYEELLEKCKATRKE